MSRLQRRTLGKRDSAATVQLLPGLFATAVEHHRAGRYAAAIRLYEKLLANAPGQSSGPNDVQRLVLQAYSNLVRALLDYGDPGAALATILRGLERAATPDLRQLLPLCVLEAGGKAATAAVRPVLATALSEGWDNWAAVAHAAAEILRHDLAAGVDLTKSDLLFAHLVSAPILDPVLERYLTGTRARFLAARVDSAVPENMELRFLCALARQCFLNEYLFDAAERESRQIDTLRRTFAGILTAKAIPESADIALLACYEPLHALDGIEALLEQNWTSPLAGLFQQQLREPLEERRLRATIPALTPINDSISVAVRGQYEENPYPRWTKPQPMTSPPISIDDYLQQVFPRADFRPLNRPKSEILVVGCGTGYHPVATAMRFHTAGILAIDLSLASLAYARRMTESLGLEQIQYAQADILKLDSLGRSFDVIEANGVLHHLADPMEGWRKLLALLRPRGVLRIGLYSALGRRHTIAAQALVRERGLSSNPQDIRTARQILLGLPTDHMAWPVTKGADFCTLSGCRDLIFHVQEHCLALSDIAKFIKECRLRFLGFETDEWTLRRYHQRFPEDPAAVRLDLWDIFENENPDCFVGMYQFWVQQN